MPDPSREREAVSFGTESLGSEGFEKESEGLEMWISGPLGDRELGHVKRGPLGDRELGLRDLRLGELRLGELRLGHLRRGGLRLGDLGLGALRKLDVAVKRGEEWLALLLRLGRCGGTRRHRHSRDLGCAEAPRGGAVAASGRRALVLRRGRRVLGGRQDADLGDRRAPEGDAAGAAGDHAHGPRIELRGHAQEGALAAGLVMGPHEANRLAGRGPRETPVAGVDRRRDVRGQLVRRVFVTLRFGAYRLADDVNHLHVVYFGRFGLRLERRSCPTVPPW